MHHHHSPLKWHSDPISCFATVHFLDRQADRQTDRQTDRHMGYRQVNGALVVCYIVSDMLTTYVLSVF